ncbi:hypothetical protein IG631_20320 [Alternaria alternata]|nr:hypothetical protein IG631_20320 [Alternaria alternata]
MEGWVHSTAESEVMLQSVHTELKGLSRFVVAVSSTTFWNSGNCDHKNAATSPTSEGQHLVLAEQQ